MNGTEVGVFQKSNEVGLRSFLESHDGGSLESSLGLDVVGNFLNESLERKFSDQKISGSLVLSDLSDGHGSWSEPVGLFDAAGGWGGLLGGALLVVLLSGSFDARGAFSCSGFSSSHLFLLY